MNFLRRFLTSLTASIRSCHLATALSSFAARASHSFAVTYSSALAPYSNIRVLASREPLKNSPRRM